MKSCPCLTFLLNCLLDRAIPSDKHLGFCECLCSTVQLVFVCYKRNMQTQVAASNINHVATFQYERQINANMF